MSNSSSPHNNPGTVPPSRRPSEPPQTSTSTLPSPQIFDIIPQLHDLLVRLLPPQPVDSLNPLAPPPAASAPQLEIQNLAREAGSLRVRIQKARQAVRDLPDMDRTCEDQEEEIKELQERVQNLRAVLTGLAEGDDDMMKSALGSRREQRQKLCLVSRPAAKYPRMAQISKQAKTTPKKDWKEKTAWFRRLLLED